jgi:hypothetical protein
LEYLYGLIRYNPLYEEAIGKIRGVKKVEEIDAPEAIGNRLMASSLMATGYGGMGGIQ